MRIIVLSYAADIEYTLQSFSPNTTFLVVSNIIGLHNEIVKHDADALFLDKNILPVWNMDVADHIKKCNNCWSCFYFNSITMSNLYIELYRVEKGRKEEPLIVTAPELERLIRGQTEVTSNHNAPLYSRLCTQQKELLHFFITNEGKLLTFKDMSEHLFGSFTEQHKKTLYTYIHTIRTYIEENPRLPKHLIRKEKGKYTYV